MLFMLVGMDRRENFYVCKVFAVLIHYMYVIIRGFYKFFGGGGVQQQKRSCRREKPKMSFVFFVLFCSFSNHVQNRRFVPNLVKNVSSKKNKKDHDFRIF